MNIRSIIGATVIAATLVAGAATVSAKEMVYGSYLPPKHNVNTYGLTPNFKALGAEGPWKLVTGGQRFSGKATLKSVGNRTAEAWRAGLAYMQGPM